MNYLKYLVVEIQMPLSGEDQLKIQRPFRAALIVKKPIAQEELQIKDHILNAMAIDNTLEYARLYLNNEIQIFIDTYPLCLS